MTIPRYKYCRQFDAIIEVSGNSLDFQIFHPKRSVYLGFFLSSSHLAFLCSCHEFQICSLLLTPCHWDTPYRVWWSLSNDLLEWSSQLTGHVAGIQYEDFLVYAYILQIPFFLQLLKILFLFSGNMLLCSLRTRFLLAASFLLAPNFMG